MIEVQVCVKDISGGNVMVRNIGIDNRQWVQIAFQLADGTTVFTAISPEAWDQLKQVGTNVDG